VLPEPVQKVVFIATMCIDRKRRLRGHVVKVELDKIFEYRLLRFCCSNQLNRSIWQFGTRNIRLRDIDCVAENSQGAVNGRGTPLWTVRPCAAQASAHLPRRSGSAPDIRAPRRCRSPRGGTRTRPAHWLCGSALPSRLR